MSASRNTPTYWDAQRLVEKLGPELAGLENYRQKIVAKRKKGTSVMMMGGALAVIAGLIGFLVAPPFGVIPGIVGFLIMAGIVNSKYFGEGKAVYEAEYKQRVIGSITKLIQPGMDYHPHRGLPEEWFHSSGLYDGADIDRYSCEDLFEGEIGKTKLWFSEIHAEDKRTRTDSKGRTQTYWVTIFRGLLVVADFHKHFKSEVIVMQDFAEATFGWLGRTLQKLGGNLERMENPAFEKAFVVRATDPVEARYILTPDMQERLLALRSRLNDDVRISFRESHVFITIPSSDDWFEPDLGLPARDPAQMHTFLGQMASCFRIVEDLNLNTRIWTKE